jgi:hypothetical protein
MMYAGDEDYGDDITSGPEPDDFEELNRNEAADYAHEDDLEDDVCNCQDPSPIDDEFGDTCKRCGRYIE